jgi:large subunit ribosomal protein L31
MKQEIHPETNPVIFRDSSNGEEFMTQSTLTSEETKKVDGTEYYVIDLEVTSASHPFYTGEQRFVDTEGQVDKFKAKMEKVEEEQEKREEIKERQKKKQEQEQQEQEKESLEDLKETVTSTEKEEEVEESTSQEAEKEEIDYESLVTNNISEIKETIKEKNLDLTKILEAEQENKDRKTLVSWLEGKIDS